MEHQSAVSIGKIPTLEYDSVEMAQLTQLLWHEASHEWWGNSVSCRDMADFWLHEAFATYAEALNIESVYGREMSVRYMNEQPLSNKEPMIGVYNVNHIFYDIGDLYNKGCLMLNTLRNVINNDTLWFSMLRGIQKEFKYQTVTTGDIEKYIKQKTGTDYGYFFDQYLRHASLPKLLLHLTEQGSSLVVKYKWQADVKNFNMPVKTTNSKNRFEFIYPASHWQTLALKGMKVEDFEVAENDFLVDVVNE